MHFLNGSREMLHVAVILCAIFTFSLQSRLFSFTKDTPTCGYESCNEEKEGMLNVHLVPHTHDDVGWLVTVDQYYYKYVQFILDSVIPELEADPSKRFIYVEIAFFSRWYKEQTDPVRHRVKKLVNEGRLEFILGGWCMNDEASTHYSAIIDQHKLGFEYLRHVFGDCGRTKIGWQIDPFGHSREQASLFAQFGFDGLFFGRLDYQDKELRQKMKTMEMIWKGSPKNLGDAANLFTGVLPYGYNPPPGYCFDYSCLQWTPNQTVIKDDSHMHDYNVEKMVDGFIKAMETQSQWYSTKHLIVPMGSDFNYVAAPMFFKEMDKLIKYVNDRQSVGSKVNVLYSTPSCYLKQLNNDNKTWTTKQDDFFPYADRAHSFWTGYFTSRPAFKYYARVVNNQFQVFKQMAAVGKLENIHKSRKQLEHLAEVLGVAQHHDAISGTEKQAVTYDYSQRLADGVNQAKNVVDDVYKKWLPRKGSPNPPKQVFCSYLNISTCEITSSSKQVQLTLYNPLARSVEFPVRVPVNSESVAVLSYDGKTSVPFDLVPATESNPVQVLVFMASLPAVGYRTFFIEKSESELKKPLRFRSEHKNDMSIGNKYFTVNFDTHGSPINFYSEDLKVKLGFNQKFIYYESHPGNNTKADTQASGAYIFRPASNVPTQVKLKSSGGPFKGKVVQEVYQSYSDFIKQTFRVYEDKPYLEVEWEVGPIPIDDKLGKEVATRYSMQLKNNSTFYTDSNGREILERIIDYRPTWNLSQTEEVAGNYYPVNALLAIKDKDEDLELVVLTDRTQGGTSLSAGNLELMLHRRTLFDDARGVGEALNETGSDGKGLVVRGKHYILLNSIRKSARAYRPTAQEVFLQPQITFSNSTMKATNWTQTYNTSFSALSTSLPKNVHLLTLEQFHYGGPVSSPSGTVAYLLRFEHFYEKDEDSDLSKPVTFDIKGMFATFDIVDLHELSLGANIPVEEVHRLNWRTSDADKDTHSKQRKRLVHSTKITLNPMEIVTLQANVKL